MFRTAANLPGLFAGRTGPGTSGSRYGTPRGSRQSRPPGQILLLRAAEELFGERSYHRTTVADICARAGMAAFRAYFDMLSEHREIPRYPSLNPLVWTTLWRAC